MKIDFNNGIANDLATNRTAKNLTASNVPASKSATLDRTTLSSSTPSVSSMVSTAMQTPEIRQDKVSALRQAVSSGTYPVDHVIIAGSIAGSID